MRIFTRVAVIAAAFAATLTATSAPVSAAVSVSLSQQISLVDGTVIDVALSGVPATQASTSSSAIARRLGNARPPDSSATAVCSRPM